jgi:hypothetical protein
MGVLSGPLRGLGNTMGFFFSFFLLDFIPLYVNTEALIACIRRLLNIRSFSEVIHTFCYRIIGYIFEEPLSDSSELLKQDDASSGKRIFLVFFCFLNSFLFSIFVLNSYGYFKVGEADQHIDYDESIYKGLFFLIFPNIRVLPLVCA